jgi:hypothetical protein
MSRVVHLLSARTHGGQKTPNPPNLRGDCPQVIAKHEDLKGYNGIRIIPNLMKIEQLVRKPNFVTHSHIVDPGTLPIESPAHDSRRTMVCAEHSYTARPSNSISYGRN